MTKTILTIDDSRTMRELLRAALDKAGFHVIQAEDGLHGLEVLRASEPDVIITDINMPRMNGLEFIEAVRVDETRRAIPIIVLTTESDEAKKMEGKAAGATGWIVKPFDQTKLVAVVNKLIGA